MCEGEREGVRCVKEKERGKVCEGEREGLGV